MARKRKRVQDTKIDWKKLLILFLLLVAICAIGMRAVNAWN